MRKNARKDKYRMAKKKVAKTPTSKPSNAAPPASELARLIAGLKDNRAGLPILADFLEEKLGLTNTAALFRAPELQTLPHDFATGDLHYYPLADDVFLWFTDCRCRQEPGQPEKKPLTLIGLYAHPLGQSDAWVQITSGLEGKFDPKSRKLRPWHPAVKPDPRIELACGELAVREGKPK
jgi:hypothetical protein